MECEDAGCGDGSSEDEGDEADMQFLMELENSVFGNSNSNNGDGGDGGDGGDDLQSQLLPSSSKRRRVDDPPPSSLSPPPLPGGGGSDSDGDGGYDGTEESDADAAADMAGMAKYVRWMKVMDATTAFGNSPYDMGGVDLDDIKFAYNELLDSMNATSNRPYDLLGALFSMTSDEATLNEVTSSGGGGGDEDDGEGGGIITGEHVCTMGVEMQKRCLGSLERVVTTLSQMARCMVEEQEGGDTMDDLMLQGGDPLQTLTTKRALTEMHQRTMNTIMALDRVLVATRSVTISVQQPTDGDGTSEDQGGAGGRFDSGPALTVGDIIKQAVPDPDDIVKVNSQYYLDLMGERAYKEFRNRRLYKSGKNMYRPVYAHDDETGRDTFVGAYHFIGTIEEVLNGMIGYDRNPDLMFMLMSRPNLVAQAAGLLENRTEPIYIPDLVRQRSTFAFKDGIYVGHKCVFLRKHSDYTCPEYKKSKNVWANRYIDEEIYEDAIRPMEESENTSGQAFLDIPTPKLDTVFDTQVRGSASASGARTPDQWKTYVWFLALIGRLFYENGELDRWQVVLWLFGTSGTGKSILLKAIQSLFNNEDVGTIANNIEEKFGVSTVMDKMLVTAPDINSQFKLDGGNFLSMVGLDKVSAAVKNKDPKEQPTFKPSMVFCGNSMPRWPDNSGQYTRRIVPFMTNVVVPDDKCDTSLEESLVKEAPRLLVKANAAYHWALGQTAAAEKEGATNKLGIWAYLPPFYQKASNTIKSLLLPFRAFLDSDFVVFDAKADVQENVLRRAYKTYCQNCSIMPIPPVSPETFESVVKRYGCTVKRDERSHMMIVEGVKLNELNQAVQISNRHNHQLQQPPLDHHQ